jgi:two-component system cell cycle response regulator DivK
MSMPMSSEQLAFVCDHARRNLERTREHEHDLNALVGTAEGFRRHAAALSVALAAAEIDAAEALHLCAAQVKRSAEHAEAVRRVCVRAREQHVTAHRQMTRFDDESAAESPAAGQRTTAVLVVDDMEDVRDLVAFVLRDAGFVVRTAANGLEALLAAYEMRPSVIVMDVSMPVLDGLEATRLIKATEGIREAKVIAYTGNTTMPLDLAERGFVAVVPKPSSPEAVLAAVQNAARLSAAD